MEADFQARLLALQSENPNVDAASLRTTVGPNEPQQDPFLFCPFLLCCVVLCCVVLRCVVLCCVVSCCAMLCCVVSCRGML